MIISVNYKTSFSFKLFVFEKRNDRFCNVKLLRTPL